MVDHHFYETAFKIYRQKYNDETNKVIFLAASDDNEWIKVTTNQHKGNQHNADKVAD